jgi:hypothetical protein
MNINIFPNFRGIIAKLIYEEIMPNSKPFSLAGRPSYQLRNIAGLTSASVKIPIRRMFRGPLVPGCSLTMEITNYFLRSQSLYSFDLPDILAGREYQDALVFYSPALAEIKTEKVSEPVKGIWFNPPLR